MLATVIAMGLLFSCLKDNSLRSRQTEIVAALAIGTVITLGWIATVVLGHDPFEPAHVERSPSFDPLARAFSL